MFLIISMVAPMKFKIGNIFFNLSFPLIASLCIVLVVDRTKTAFCAVINAILHELGHLIVLYRYGCRVKTINLGLFDINIKKSECPLSINQEIAVALSGAAANILSAIIYISLYQLFDLKLFLTLTISTLCLAAFNLLPVESLDGGSTILFLLLKRMEYDKASKILNIISLFFLLPMAVVGVILLIKSKYNFTLLFTSCYLTGIILLKKKNDQKIGCV